VTRTCYGAKVAPFPRQCRPRRLRAIHQHDLRNIALQRATGIATIGTCPRGGALVVKFINSGPRRSAPRPAPSGNPLKAGGRKKKGRKRGEKKCHNRQKIHDARVFPLSFAFSFFFLFFSSFFLSSLFSFFFFSFLSFFRCTRVRCPFLFSLSSFSTEPRGAHVGNYANPRNYAYDAGGIGTCLK